MRRCRHAPRLSSWHPSARPALLVLCRWYLPAGACACGGTCSVVYEGVMDMAYPFTGRCLVQNSPADRVPSHGTALFATSHAIDFVPVDPRGRSAPVSLRSLVWPEPPQRFSGFGCPLLAPINGIVVAAHDEENDHSAHRGLPSIRYALAQGRRVRQGWMGLAGNHVIIESSAGGCVALCHLQRDSLQVSVGQAVEVGHYLGQCGNSGNSTEPHVHVQAMTQPDPSLACALPISFHGELPRNGRVVVARTDG